MAEVTVLRACTHKGGLRIVDPRQLRKTVWVAPTPAFAPVAIYFPHRRSLKAETLVSRT